ncbi:phosphatidic acid phosphatase type 2/haloperoxidase [Blastocladiella britannica]|nr:phosphatidic acid phosphatase type 2/haloperoxidase [Blastocladiella britannica]
MGSTCSALAAEVLKNVVGRLRPDFLARCNAVIDPFTKLPACTGDPHTVMLGRQSFPSSHSVEALAGWGFLVLFLSGTLSSRSRSNPWVVCLLMSLGVLPLVVSISRITDNRHHTEDVLGGGLIGLAAAVFWYRVYFVPPKSHLVRPDTLPRGAPYTSLDPLLLQDSSKFAL